MHTDATPAVDVAEVEPTIVNMATSMARLALGVAKQSLRSRIHAVDYRAIQSFYDGFILVVTDVVPLNPLVNQRMTIHFHVLNATRKTASGHVRMDTGESVDI